MTFPPDVVEKLLVSCHRHCCICHKSVGNKIEIHHIVPKSERGEDSEENGIPLCFDCHAEVGAYNSRHPKGRKFTSSELRKHKEQWFAICEKSPWHLKPHHPEFDKQGIALGDVQGLVFEHFDIELDNSHWRRSIVPGQPYPFEREAERYYCLTIFDSLADPSFDITVLNVASRPVLLAEVGVKIVAIADIWEERGGGPFVVGPILTSDAYLLLMPDLRDRQLLEPPSEISNRVCQVCNVELDELVSMRLVHPIYIGPGAPYRYILRLNGFRDRCPNNVILHLWAQCSMDEVLSCPIHLFICDGN